jgi:transposase-like protein
MTRWFLSELHHRYQLDDVLFPVDDADYLGPVLAEDGYRFQTLAHGNRNAIESIFWEIEQRTSSSANIFSHVELETAQELLEAFAVYHNSRQRACHRKRHVRSGRVRGVCPTPAQPCKT